MQPNLFDDLPLPPVQGSSTGDTNPSTITAVTALKARASNNAKLSSTQRRFNELLAQVENLSHELEDLKALEVRHGTRYQQVITPLSQQLHTANAAFILHLHTQIQVARKNKAFTPSQSRWANELMRDFLQEFDTPDLDPKLAPLMAVYFPQDTYEGDDADAFDDLAEEEQAQIKEEILRIARVELGAGALVKESQTMDSDELLALLQSRVQEKEEARADKLRAKREAKAAAKKATKDGAAVQAASNTEPIHDPKTVLKTIFRQLASALHPDRESDEGKRAEKSALMSQVNAAYERSDLMTLLRIQLQVTQIDAAHTSTLADAQLKAMSQLLKDQVNALFVDCKNQRHSIVGRFGYESYDSLDETNLIAHLQSQAKELQRQINGYERDIAKLQNDAHLKDWLKYMREQRKEWDRQEREEEKAMRRAMRFMTSMRGW